MFNLPPIPAWDALHPSVVHFPVALLLIAPVFVAAGMVRRTWRGFSYAGLVLMVLGTGFLVLSLSTGEAAEDAAERIAAAGPVLHEHEELAETARTMFIILTVVYASLLIAAGVLRDRLKQGLFVGLSVVFLGLYAAGALVLVNTAHAGGRLVHEFGVRAPIAGNAAADAGGGTAAREAAAARRSNDD